MLGLVAEGLWDSQLRTGLNLLGDAFGLRV